MQNRTNRNLLFGTRATVGAAAGAGAGGSGAGDAAVSITDAETMEGDNQQSIEHLRGSAGTMKDIALHVDASVNEQNRMLDKMDKRFESSNSMINNTLSALNEMAADRPSAKMCAVIGTFFVILMLLYFLFFR